MAQHKEDGNGKRLAVGILAHVDAGKTTLSEALLYQSGSLRRLGRVDHGDAFLDTEALERERGITIFAKQAVFSVGGTCITLLDTPGHVDFSAEAERTLQVLDYAVLVISGTDGVQGHTRTLWNLLAAHHIPTFLFFNKMDLPGADKAALLAEARAAFGEGCIDFSLPGTPQWEEALAMQGDEVMEAYLETGTLPPGASARLVAQRRVFPCLFGSALRCEGVDALLAALEHDTLAPAYGPEFAAQVYKVSYGGKGERLTHLKVTGGVLRAKQLLCAQGGSWQQKADQLRIYSGAKYMAVAEAPAGTVCAVTGLSHTYAGEALGCQPPAQAPVLEPVLTYRVLFPEEQDVHTALQKLRTLEEEDPQLRVSWNAQLGEVHMRVMGEVQLEVLARLAQQRFGLALQFDEGGILYKETIASPVEGMGHFEPLRHYAEVHLLLEPAARGSGLHFSSACSEDMLDKNWQRLILTHLAEKVHAGVLTGAPITDMNITLVAGRAHSKHTEGGDFRQATYRALRQGLRSTESILLEPCYAFRLEVPAASLGRAMADVQRMNGSFEPPQLCGETAVLTGTAPVATMRGYAREVAGYTQGMGRFSAVVQGYAPCHNAAQVIAAAAYSADADTENTADSVFCGHGAGFTVKWNEAPALMHVPPVFRPAAPAPPPAQSRPREAAKRYTGTLEEDKELEAIFVRTFGPIRRRDLVDSAMARRPREAPSQPQQPVHDYLLVDGYNIIFAWDELKELAKENIDAARAALADILCNYQGFRQCHVILVFDAYKVRGGRGEVQQYGGICIVYTKEAETADMYIEKATYQLAGRHRVRVATSDGAEQLIILGHGALRMSARALKEEVELADRQIAEILAQRQ